LEEHTIIREGRVISPDPQENHLEHLLAHTQMLQSPDIVTWPKEAVQMLTQHIEEHKQMMIQIMQFQQQQGGAGGGQGPKAGGPGQKAEGSNGAAGKPGASGSAAPNADAAPNQTAGTTAGAAAF